MRSTQSRSASPELNRGQCRFKPDQCVAIPVRLPLKAVLSMGEDLFRHPRVKEPSVAMPMEQEAVMGTLSPRSII